MRRLWQVLPCVLIAFGVSALQAQTGLTPSEDVSRAISQLSAAGFEGRREASKVLSGIGEPAVVPLLSLLRSEDPGDRWWAALTLGRIKDPRTISPLIGALGDANWLVRFWAAWALGEIKYEGAVEPLISTLDDSEILVVKMALDSLREITGEGFGRDRRVWEAWLKANQGSFRDER